MERAVALPMAAIMTPLLVLAGLAAQQRVDGAAERAFSASAHGMATVCWMTDAPFQSPALEEAEGAAEHASAPHAEQSHDVLVPDRLAVRRTRIGGLYGP